MHTMLFSSMRAAQTASIHTPRRLPFARPRMFAPRRPCRSLALARDDNMPGSYVSGLRIQDPCSAPALQLRVETFYEELLTQNNPDALDALAAPSIVFSDVVGGDDFVTRSGVAQYFAAFAATHPVLRFELLDVLVDAGRATAMAHWRATVARLAPTPRSGDNDGSSVGHSAPQPSGAVAEVTGLDRLSFEHGGAGRIVAVQSYRQRVEGDDVVALDWSEDEWQEASGGAGGGGVGAGGGGGGALHPELN